MYFRTISTVLLGIFGLAMAQIPLTFDLSKDQIFVQGNWYNKDGSNGKSVVTPHAFFTQCMHHENASGCDTTWSQVSTFEVKGRNFVGNMYTIFCYL